MQKKEKNRDFWIIFHFQLIFSWFCLKTQKCQFLKNFPEFFFWFLQILDRNCPWFLKIIVPCLDQDFFNFAFKTWGVIQITIRNFEVPWRFMNFSSLRLNFPLRNSNEAMQCVKQAHPLTTSSPAPFTVHAHHGAQTVIATTAHWGITVNLGSWFLSLLLWQIDSPISKVSHGALLTCWLVSWH